MTKTKEKTTVYKQSLKTSREVYKFPVIIEKDEDGLYVADCSDLQGCHAQGNTLEEAITNIRDAIELNLKILKEDKQDIPRLEPVSMTSLEVSI